MAKVALLVGVSEYQPGLTPLPGASQDAVAMQQVLQQAGSFDDIQILENPDPLALQEAVEGLFSSRKKDDLALLFFSGHGIKDDSGRLYFATSLTRKNAKGDLVKATAVPASFLHDIMGNSRCKRQVVILDCCFSGAFAEGMQAKDDGVVDLRSQLGGEGRAVLTSSSSTQYSFEQSEEALSVYTRFIVEGIQTGAADADNDGLISIDELHEYASAKVQEVAPAMKPKIYAVEEGFKIQLAQAPVNDPTLRYRKEVNQFASRGEISAIGRSTLDILRQNLSLSTEVAAAIEAEVLKPYQEYQQHLQQYKDAFAQAIEQETPLSDITRQELKRFQQILGLEDKDIKSIERQLSQPASQSVSPPASLPVKTSATGRLTTPLTQPSPPATPIQPVSTPARVTQSTLSAKKIIWMGVAGLVSLGMLVGAIVLLTEPDDPDDDFESDIELRETAGESSSLSTAPSSDSDPEAAEAYGDPNGFFEIQLPDDYTIEIEEEGSEINFESSDGGVVGYVLAEETNESYSEKQLIEYVKENAPATRVWKGNICLDQSNYACVPWHDNDDLGDPVGGVSLVRQDDDVLILIDFDSADLGNPDYRDDINFILDNFEPVIDSPLLNILRHMPAPPPLPE